VQLITVIKKKVCYQQFNKAGKLTQALKPLSMFLLLLLLLQLLRPQGCQTLIFYQIIARPFVSSLASFQSAKVPAPHERLVTCRHKLACGRHTRRAFCYMQA
jgi:hypothetical protein